MAIVFWWKLFVTDANGDYSFTVPMTGGPYRVEFMVPPHLDNLEPTFNGADNGTTVQFIDGPTCGVDLGLTEPDCYCQDNPNLLVPCWAMGDPLAPGSNIAADPALVQLDYNHASPKQDLLTASQIGTTWGLAHDVIGDKTYLASVIRRHAGLGPDGLGAIYVYENTSTGSGTLSGTSITIPNAGSIPDNPTRGLSGTSIFSNDPDAFDLVGKAGIGDIDIDPINQILYAVNLNDKQIYELDLTSGATTATPLANSYTEPSCTMGQFRPWALKYSSGKLYLGGVCSAEDQNGSTDASNLSATVLEYDITNGTWTTILSFDLDYPRENPYPGHATGWYPWLMDNLDVPGINHASTGEVFFSFPSPILSDIEFADDGHMIIGFIDRTAMQFGARNYGTANTTRYYAVSGGDI